MTARDTHFRTTQERSVRDWLQSAVEPFAWYTGATYSLPVVTDGRSYVLQLWSTVYSVTAGPADTPTTVLTSLADSINADASQRAAASVQAGPLLVLTPAAGDALVYPLATPPLRLEAYTGRQLVPVMHGRQEAPQPELEHVRLLPGSVTQLGEAEVDAIYAAEETQASRTHVQQAFDVMFIGPRARQMARRARSWSFDLDGTLRADQLAIELVMFDILIDVGRAADTIYEQRTAAVVTVGYVDHLVADASNRIIESVEATGTVGEITEIIGT